MNWPRFKPPLLVILLLLAFPVTSLGESIQVPGDESTIGAALDRATDGDVVFVHSGTYYEHDLLVRRGIMIVGETGPHAEVIIDAQRLGRVILCEGVDETTVIQGLTLTGGRADGQTSYDSSGGGLLCSNSAPWIVKCRFVNNEAAAHGGGLRCSHASPMLVECTFDNNRAEQGGGGADCSYDANPTFNSCRFTGNSAAWGGAIACRSDAFPILNNCIIDGNSALEPAGYGGGIFCDFDAAPVLNTCTLSENVAVYGGAVACFEDGNSRISNSTIAFNEAQVGGGLYCLHTSPALERTIIAFQIGAAVGGTTNAHPIAECCDFFGNTGGDWTGPVAGLAGILGNIAVDPRFCPREGGEVGNPALYLKDDSPCSDEHNSCGLVGAWPADCDLMETFLAEFVAASADGAVEIRWRVHDSEALIFRLQATMTRDDQQQAWDVNYRRETDSSFAATDRSPHLFAGGSVTYTLSLQEPDGSWTYLDHRNLTIDVPALRTDFQEIFPNPFNPQTTISFTVGNPQRVEIGVYDLTGHHIVELADEVYATGRHSLVWNGRDDTGRFVSSGTYLVLLRTVDELRTRKLTLLK